MTKPSKVYLIIMALLAVLCFGAGGAYGRHSERQQTEAAALLLSQPASGQPVDLAENDIPPESSHDPEPPLPQLAVHVKGAVERPGLYWLEQGSRVDDALTLAGLDEGANTDIVNLAAPLNDGMEIIVPFQVEGQETDWQALALNARNSSESGGTTAIATNKININNAGLAALQTLNGIGEAKAQAIVSYREQHGPFQKIEDIKKVSGIGEATFGKLKDFITVE